MLWMDAETTDRATGQITPVSVNLKLVKQVMMFGPNQVKIIFGVNDHVVINAKYDELMKELKGVSNG